MVQHVISRPGTAVPAAEERYVDLFGRRFYRIEDYDELAPFFMAVVGSGDAWLFVSSTGGLTAGRVEPDSALFPYYTDDKVSESAGRTGGLSLLRVSLPGSGIVLWEPLTTPPHLAGSAHRTLYKDALGTALVFEETRGDLGLRLRVTWSTGRQFGIARSCELTNLGGQPVEVELVDGLVNVLPAGIEVSVQDRLSSLLDAYKRSEVDPRSGLGMFWLSSRLTDLAEPSESLHANVAWHVGLGAVDHLASTRQLPGFRRDGSFVGETDVRGRRGAYLVHTRLVLQPGAQRTWSVVGDVQQDAADVVALRDLLSRPEQAAGALAADLADSRVELERIVASADGVQVTGDELAATHHGANVLFNVMRGGLPSDGYRIEAQDVCAFIEQRSPSTARRCAALLAGMPEDLTIGELVRGARTSREPDLIRLALEYLPFTFSRRHGDPSRPWNKFQISLRDEHGNPRLNYQGNWRDIFQNWEALAWSFPEYLQSMVTVFLDATTADGYNPYRISRAGIDWEVPEPENPWANIGYWSDHQIVYLLRLLEASERFHPGRLGAMLDAQVFTHADVPYRIDTYDEILRDPFDTITFDVEHADRIEARIVERGADGRLVHGPDGDLVRVTMAEKLLLLLLAKLVNLVPDGGIWMNTQRPEWNDANNALVGRGLSVVTLAQLRRYVELARGLITEEVSVTEELADLLRAVAEALEAHRGDLEAGFTDATRRSFMDRLGAVGSAYRQRVYSGFSGARTVLPGVVVAGLLDSALTYVEAGLRANLRPDAMYHSYNILELGPGSAAIRRLPEMLEGQVALLASGFLDADQSLDLLNALRASRLYRADQHSYLLYPDRELAGFLARNRISQQRAAECALLGALVATGDRSLVVADVNGDLHFAAGIRNARDVEAALNRLGTGPDLAAAVRDGRGEVRDIFEEVFDHASFTGRSGTFFAYEGLGSIYWHMVSKLLLAVQETLERAVAEGEPGETARPLAEAYEDIRSGLGYCKSVAVYGAFPTDPYSHTPAGQGARQPGMTGQVKEEVLTRLGELGLRVEDGQVVFRPVLLRASEWLESGVTLAYTDVRGHPGRLDLPEGSLAFTFCQVPVVVSQAARLEVRVVLEDGAVVDCPDGWVSADLSASIFQREGTVRRIEVRTPASI